MRNRFVFLGNGSYLNRGCEAIVRGTTTILDKHFGVDYQVTNASFLYYEGQLDVQREQETDDRIEQVSLSDIRAPVGTPRRFSRAWTRRQLSRLLHMAPSPRPTMYHELRAHCPQAVAALQIGGDNYTLDYGKPHEFMEIDREVIRWSIPLVLWGASIGPFSSDPEFEATMIEHLGTFSAICVREDLSYAYLQEKAPSLPVYRVEDPAFALAPQEPTDFEHADFISGSSTIGVNLSPLFAQYTEHGLYERWAGTCTRIISALLAHFEVPIVLIPHVTAGIGMRLPVKDPYHADELFMRGVLNRLSTQERKRVVCLENRFSAAETKWIISQCSGFIGTRTHSQIAALSCGIPTLSLAYSRKAVGLNEALFGSDSYCLSAKDVSPDAIIRAYGQLSMDAPAIRATLETRMPDYRTRALEAGSILRSLCDARKEA